MRFNILVLTDRVATKKIDDDLKLTRRYFGRRTPLKLNFTVQPVDAGPLAHKSFGIFEAKGSKQELYGLDGIKDKLRKHVPYARYQAVVFIYQLEETTKRVAHWTHFKEIHPGTEFVEIAFLNEWDKRGDVYRVLSHELIHVFHNRARRKGIATDDTMDMYDKEWEIEATDGNRARNIKELQPHFKQIAHQPQLWTLLRSLIKQYYDERPWELKELDKTKGTRLEAWAEAIKEFEGWHIGSCSYRGNNLGNLRWSKFEIGSHTCGSSGKFSVFKDYETGRNALIYQLQIAADGRSNVYEPSDTLLEFFRKFAPSSDNNYPERYAKFVAEKLGVTVMTRISSLL